MTSVQPSTHVGHRTPYAGFIARKVENLWERSLKYSYQRGLLASLRRAAGKTPGSVPSVWAVTMDGIDKYEDAYWVRQIRRSTPDAPTPHEYATHIALTLYATHQRGQNTIVHREGATLGTAIQALNSATSAPSGEGSAIQRRFAALASSQDIMELEYHLRGLTSLFRGGQRRNTLGIDYGLLAQDLVDFQHPEYRERVLLRWSRDFFKSRSSQTTEAITPNVEGDLS